MTPQSAAAVFQVANLDAALKHYKEVFGFSEEFRFGDYAGIQQLDDVRDQIERILAQQMGQISQERWLERLRRNGYVKHF